MSKKTKYEKLCEELKASTKNSAYSKTALQEIANGFMNDTEHSVKKFVAKDDESFETVETNPAKDFRAALKPVIKKTFGVDTAELDKLDEAELPKKVTDAMMDCAQAIEYDYMKTGKKLKYPVYSETDAIMSVGIRNVEEKTLSTKKIVQNDDGSYASVPTGDTFKYEKHGEMTSSNKLPKWLKKKIN